MSEISVRMIDELLVPHAPHIVRLSFLLYARKEAPDPESRENTAIAEDENAEYL